MSINKKISRKTSCKNKRSINRKTKRQVKRRGGFKKKTINETLENTKFCYPTWYIKSNDGEYKQGTLGVPVGVDNIAIKKKELLEQLKKNGFENVNEDDIKLLPSLKPITFNGKLLLNGNNIDQLAYIPKKITWGDKSERVCYNKDLSLDDWNKLYPKKEDGEDIKKIDPVSQPQPPEKSTFVPVTNISKLNSEIENNNEEAKGGRRKKTKRRKSKKTRRKSRKTRRKPRVLRTMKRRI